MGSIQTKEEEKPQIVEPPPDSTTIAKPRSQPTDIANPKLGFMNPQSNAIPQFGSPLITGNGRLSDPDSHVLQDPKAKKFPVPLSWSQGGKQVMLLVPTKEGKERELPMNKSREDFATMLDLTPGTHQFRFRVDGELKVSSEHPTVSDSQGNLVNYVEVTEEGLAFQLDPWNDQTLTSATNAEAQEDAGFSQKFPEFENERDPPHLPPHLNKVILNSEPVSQSDSTVLPPPQHVILDHLYALSIRDDVMVLASTSRFKQKYVTSVLYKPVFT
eukprot:Lithocolla_globosa_v1_NODE_5044_length_1314_cov_58.181890.p1 type:complete len:272 gc:universal NODE_5044_length_1314_cov_58.181890:1144-329(-)